MKQNKRGRYSLLRLTFSKQECYTTTGLVLHTFKQENIITYSFMIFYIVLIQIISISTCMWYYNNAVFISLCLFCILKYNTTLITLLLF